MEMAIERYLISGKFSKFNQELRLLLHLNLNHQPLPFLVVKKVMRVIKKVIKMKKVDQVVKIIPTHVRKWTLLKKRKLMMMEIILMIEDLLGRLEGVMITINTIITNNHHPPEVDLVLMNEIIQQQVMITIIVKDPKHHDPNTKHLKSYQMNQQPAFSQTYLKLTSLNHITIITAKNHNNILDTQVTEVITNLVITSLFLVKSPSMGVKKVVKRTFRKRVVFLKMS